MKYLVMAFLMSQAADAELARIDEWAKTQPENGLGKAGIADEYYKVSKKFPKEKARFMDKANEFWLAGWSDLQEFHQDKIRENLRKIYAGPAAPGKALDKSWSQGQFIKADVSSAIVHSGAYAIRVFPQKSNTGLAEGLKIKVKVQPGKEHVLSFWSLSDGVDGDESVVLHVYDGSGKEVQTQTASLRKDVPVWAPVKWTFTPPEGAVNAEFVQVTSSKKGAFYIDDFSLKIAGVETFKDGGLEGK